MKYRTMPKSRDALSVLGLGLMRLPTRGDGSLDEEKSMQMLHYALERGINYFDTAWGYHHGASEPLLGKFIAQTDRSRFYIATKLPCWLIKTPADMDEYLDKQLERLQTDHIDYYLLHALNKKSWDKMKSFGMLDWLSKIKADKKIRHIGFSFHDSYPVFRKIVESFDWDFCQFMLNYLDTHYQAGYRGYQLALQKNMGVISMEPLRGGKLVSPIPPEVEKVWLKSSETWSAVERGLRWVWNLSGCTVLLSGMGSLKQIEENIAIAERSEADSLSPRELDLYKKARREYLRRIAIPCTECRYCLPCPHKVGIPNVFGTYNESVMFGEKERHKREYETFIPEEARADKCVNCGACLAKCPQKIDIPSEMAKVREYFK